MSDPRNAILAMIAEVPEGTVVWKPISRTFTRNELMRVSWDMIARRAA